MLYSIILHTLLAIAGLQQGSTTGLCIDPAVGLHRRAAAPRITAVADASETAARICKDANSSTVYSSTSKITLEEYRQAEATVGNPESPTYNEEAFCRVIYQALDAGILGEADKMRAQYRLEIAAKNRPGTIASDFKFIDRDDDDRSLHSIQTTKPILLIFYDPDCDHCMQAIARIRDTDLTKRTQIVAIYAEEDREHWEETAPQLPDAWIVGFATDPIQDDETYVFLSSPSIYLLDKDKKVILKDTTLDAVENFINSKP